MARYIDADALLQEFDIESNIHGNGLWHFTGIKAMIENQPTAFNLDKVVQELEEMSFDDGCGRDCEVKYQISTKKHGF